MFLTRDANSMCLEGWSEHDIALTMNTMRKVYEKLPGDGYYVEIPKMFHVNFTDIPYWSPAFSLIGMVLSMDRGDLALLMHILLHSLIRNLKVRHHHSLMDRLNSTRK